MHLDLEEDVSGTTVASKTVYLFTLLQSCVYTVV